MSRNRSRRTQALGGGGLSDGYGNVMPDDIVSFWGRWRRGVLHARYAFSHRTQAWIELQRSYTWVALAVTVCVVVVLIAYFYGPVSQLFVRAHEWGIAQ